jgi:hypothetical protein
MATFERGEYDRSARHKGQIITWMVGGSRAQDPFRELRGVRWGEAVRVSVSARAKNQSPVGNMFVARDFSPGKNVRNNRAPQ